jgi:hypothetical protein
MVGAVKKNDYEYHYCNVALGEFVLFIAYMSGR